MLEINSQALNRIFSGVAGGMRDEAEIKATSTYSGAMPGKTYSE
jgi:ATP-dependent Lon protease